MKADIHPTGIVSSSLPPCIVLVSFLCLSSLSYFQPSGRTKTMMLYLNMFGFVLYLLFIPFLQFFYIFEGDLDSLLVFYAFPLHIRIVFKLLGFVLPHSLLCGAVSTIFHPKDFLLRVLLT